MKQIERLVDEVSLAHAHGDEQYEMYAADDNRIDGLRVREYTCMCGFAAAVLSRVEDEQPGPKWPFTFPGMTPLA